MQDAKSSFISLESAIRSAFIGIGVNGIQGSVMKTLGINERMQLLFHLTHAGLENGYQFDFETELRLQHDWLNVISPLNVCFENECFTMNDQVGKIYTVSEFPKSLESDIVSSLTKMNCTSFVTVNNELLDLSGFKQEIARKYMAVGMKIENEKQRNRNNNDYLADASQKLLNEKEKLDTLWNNIDDILEEQLPKWEQQQKDLSQKQDIFCVAREKYEEIHTKREAAERILDNCRAGILAEHLEEGQKCPVCGSQHHPEPASLPEQFITEEQFKKLQKQEEERQQQKQATSVQNLLSTYLHTE